MEAGLKIVKGNQASSNLPPTAGISISILLPTDGHHNPLGLQSRNKHPQVTEECLEAQRDPAGGPLNSETCQLASVNHLPTKKGSGLMEGASLSPVLAFLLNVLCRDSGH